MGVIAAVVGCVFVGLIMVGVGMARSAQARREARLRELQYSLNAARSSYSYGSNTYGTNSYRPNAYVPQNTYAPPSNPTYGVPSSPSFVTNGANRLMSDISGVMYARMSMFRACAASDPRAGAQMATRFMIRPNGTVLTAYTAPGGSSGSYTVDNCVNTMVRGVVFSATPGYQYSTVVFPITLR